MEIVLYMLRDSVSVFEPAITDVEIIKWLHLKSYNEIFRELCIYGTEYREFYKMIEKIPFSKSIKIQMSQNKELLDKQYVHKQNGNNVLLSKGVKISNSNMIFYNAYTKTEEIFLDHIAEDHVEGILLAEICRQTAIATINLCLESSKVFVLLEDKKIYKKFVNRNKDIFIKSYAMGEKDGLGFCVINIIQDGEVCLKALMRGRNYESKTEYINE
ncbi:TPA: AfsA-related hotdog domain-containing protein [Clostridioides difficile]|nr:AfsA-related hotdog domain-containing protein [Clostridioides difficile]MCI4311699.1 hypothetical protein [Clostridioides difficile]MDI7798943.1 AfsA-related hotdog domain-containing protein [Clostridioides difficile]HBF2376510.1 hypothetical protein [Clostridioides difficile]HBF3932704.1 hypothetical protein [Clostridioides difficile]HBF8974446.1 hypothetical protein [Clostridioides difficile]